MNSFNLNPKLAEDSIPVADMKLCRLRLMDNSNFPWLILIPGLANIVEITDLSGADYLLLNKEILKIAQVMREIFTPDKLNIATIGNIVSQLHIHIVARYRNDIAFPGVVWGANCVKYQPQQANELIKLIKEKI